MNSLTKVFFFLSILSGQALWSQCEQVFVSGKVMDTMNVDMFYNLMVINKTSGRGVFGQPDGHFSVYVRPGDKIALSTKGYPVYEFIATADGDCQNHILAYIERIPQEIEQVVVRPLKSLEQIKEERQALSQRETRTVTGINVMESPITAIH